MKKTLIIAIVGILTFSCSKKEAEKNTEKTDSTNTVDSINAARTKINDSIKALNSKKPFSEISAEVTNSFIRMTVHQSIPDR